MRLEIDARNLGKTLGHRRIVIYDCDRAPLPRGTSISHSILLELQLDAKYLHTYEELVDFCRAPASIAPLPSPHIIRLNCRAAFVRRSRMRLISDSS